MEGGRWWIIEDKETKVTKSKEMGKELETTQEGNEGGKKIQVLVDATLMVTIGKVGGGCVGSMGWREDGVQEETG